jgi:FdhD protein
MIDSTARVPVRRWKGGELAASDDDLLAVEAPLAIELRWHEGEAASLREQTVAVTMRTPGHDEELAVGFLFTEGIVRRSEDMVASTQSDGTVRIELSSSARVDLASLERHSYVSSACGVCGKTSLDGLRGQAAGTKPALWRGPRLEAQVAQGMPAALRRGQATFDATGGLHAAGLFDRLGQLEYLREDVGRHNAVDKLVGAALLAGRLPLSDRILVLSGRASFELLQKAAVAGVPVVAAIGAPSSLAVEVARDAGITLLGFLRHDRFNVYAGVERIDGG